MSDLAANESSKSAISIASALDMIADGSARSEFRPLVDRRVALVCLVAVGLGMLAAIASERPCEGASTAPSSGESDTSR
jgi:hypothetical protein